MSTVGCVSLFFFFVVYACIYTSYHVSKLCPNKAGPNFWGQVLGRTTPSLSCSLFFPCIMPEIWNIRHHALVFADRRVWRGPSFTFCLESNACRVQDIYIYRLYTCLLPWLSVSWFSCTYVRTMAHLRLRLIIHIVCRDHAGDGDESRILYRVRIMEQA